jgi:hypothetical protein
MQTPRVAFGALRETSLTGMNPHYLTNIVDDFKPNVNLIRFFVLNAAR